MTVKKRTPLFSFAAFITVVFGTKHMRNMAPLDTFTYQSQMKTGKVSMFFDDVPTLTPYPVPGDTAVIVAPGGGFCYQEREKEGSKVAKLLNDRGITAFVLDYRMNPYEAPVFYLDMQRAIRYVRFHSSDYGLDPNRIGICGFSAGGYICGASEILLANAPVNAPGYTPDEVDSVDGHPSFMGLFYPVVSHDDNQNMLGVFDRKDFFSERDLPNLKKKFSLTLNVKTDCAPQFLCYGNKDLLKGMKEYADRLDEIGARHRTLVMDGANHSFILLKKYAWWIDEFTNWIRQTTDAA